MEEESSALSSAATSPIVIALLWAGTLEWYRRSPVTGLIGVGIMIAIIAGWAFVHRRSLVSRTSFWLGAILFLLTSLGAISFLTLVLTQVVVIVGTSIVAWMYLDQATHATTPLLQGRVAIFVMAITYYCGILSLLSFSIFLTQPWWVVAVVGTILYLGVTIIVWLDLEIGWATFRRSLPWVALLGAELSVLAWWLPTSIFVGSFVAAVMGLMMIHLGRHVWKDSWQPGRGRRYLAFSAAIILLVLLTARWF